MNFCFEGLLNQIGTFCTCAMVNFLVVFSERKRSIKFLLASLKTLTNSKYCSESCIRINVQLFFTSIDLFPSLLLCYRSIFRRSMAGFRNNFQDHRRLPVCILTVRIAVLGFLKRITERIFTRDTIRLILRNSLRNIFE